MTKTCTMSFFWEGKLAVVALGCEFSGGIMREKYAIPVNFLHSMATVVARNIPQSEVWRIGSEGRQSNKIAETERT